MPKFKSENLPNIIPVFPLRNALLLPGGRLPLHIFEPCYLDLVNLALKTGGLFGMVQPKTLEHKSLFKSDLLYPIGCLGEIVGVTEQESGALDILVLGIARYKIVEELNVKTTYRQVEVDYKPFQQDIDIVEFLPTGGRQKLLETVNLYMEKQGLSLNQEVLAKLGDDALVTSLSIMCPFEPAEKQALLENLDIKKRALTLGTLMEFAIADIDDISKVAQH